MYIKEDLIIPHVSALRPPAALGRGQWGRGVGGLDGPGGFSLGLWPGSAGGEPGLLAGRRGRPGRVPSPCSPALGP